MSPPSPTPPHAFRDPALLRQALTVPCPNRAEPDNQRLEFLGDAVLGVLVAERLFLAHPELDEGGLTIWHDALVSTQGLAARLPRLGAWFEEGLDGLGKGYHRTEKAKVDACEAVIGAAWLDGGRPAAEAILARLYVEADFAEPPAALAEAAARLRAPDANPKGRLLQFAQNNHIDLPAYTRLAMSGPPHAPCFRVSATCAGRTAEGTGPSLKKAETAAAQALLDCLTEETS